MKGAAGRSGGSEQVSNVVVMVIADTCSEKKRVGADSRRRSASH